MFAVIKTGGKQYRVAENDTILVEKLACEPGETIELKDVLILGEDGKAPTVGTPLVDKAAVFAEVIDQTRLAKILVYKKKRRQGYERTRGHRQHQTVLRIVGISPDGTKPATAAKAAPKKAAPKAEDKADNAAEAKTEAKKAPAKKAAPKKAATSKAKTETKKKAPAKKPAAKKETKE